MQTTNKRALGYQELFHTKYAKDGQFLVCMILNISSTMAVENVASSMDQALQIVTRRHPIFGSQIVEEQDGMLYLQETNFTSPCYTFDVCAEEDLQVLWQQEMNKHKFACTGAIRLHVVMQKPKNQAQDFHFVCTYHHLIMDGRASLVFVDELMQVLAALEEGIAIPKHLLEKSAFPPSDVQVLKPYPQDSPQQQESTKQAMLMPIEKTATWAERVQSGMILQVEEQHVQHFIATCKKNGTGFHAGLAAALVYPHMQQQMDKQGKFVNIFTPYDLLNRNKESVEHVANYFGVVLSPLDLTDSFWQFAKSYQQHLTGDITEHVYEQKLFSNYENLKKQDIHEYCAWADPFGKKQGRVNFLGLSNLGNVTKLDKQYGKFSVYSVPRFSTGVLWGSNFYVSAHTLHGKLHLAVAYVQPMLSKQTVEAYMDSVIHVIKNCSELQ